MMNSSVKSLTWAAIALLCIAPTACDRLPPRTPHKAARLVSGLSIPSSAKVLRSDEEWSEFNGDGHSKIEIALDSASFSRVRRQAQGQGYRQLAATDSLSKFVHSIWGRNPVGLMQMNGALDSGSQQLTILDDQTRRVLVYTSIQ